MDTSKRLYYFDNLRIICAILIVFGHCITGYLFKHSFVVPDCDIIDSPFGLYSLYIIKSFCVELFFFISGYMLDSEVERKSINQILVGKIIRLGIPCILFQLLQFGLHINTMLATWYMEVLLLFVLLMMVVKYKFGSITFRMNLSFPRLVIITLIMGLLTYVIRQKYTLYEPICKPFFHFEPSEMVKFIIMFYMGAMFHRNNWEETISHSAVKVINITVIIIIGVGYILRRNIIEIAYDNYLIFALMDCFQCMFVCLCLIFLFKQLFNKSNRLLAALGAQTMGVYLLHDFVIIGLQVCLLNTLAISTPFKILILFILTILISYSFISALKRIPLVSKVI